MSRPKPFLHFKSSISASSAAGRGSVRALKSSASPPSSFSANRNPRRLLSVNNASSSPRHGTSPLARQSLRDKSPQSQHQQQSQQKRQRAIVAPAATGAVVQQKVERTSTGEAEGGGTMVKMTASASRMAFSSDAARHAKATMSARPGDPNAAEHLSRVASRARTATIAVRRTQSAKSKRSASRGSSASGHSSKKKGGTAKLLELGPLRFMAKDTGKVKLIRQDSQRPGLRAMLYGLTLKMEREEKLQKKLLRKRALQEEKAMLQAPTAPIDASKFVAYVQERRKKRILFKGEFLMIQRSVDPQRCTTEVGVRMGERNQYPDTLPYDHNRVVLELRPGVDDSHYINASYVNSWIREKAYVVTQSVRSKQASNEMWRTVWELGSNTMVMLTKIFDFMRVMCLQYWPQTHFQFGEIHVETLETRTYAHFVIRTFRLRKTGGPGGLNGPAGNANGDGTADSAEEERIVKHFHFTEWELNSFPYISAFVELRRRVRQWMEKSPVDAPIVVHCSNGGGRSGAFLALDANLELLQRTGQLDVYEYGRTLANSRQHLIDTVDQYIFIYDVLCEAVLCNIQPIGMHQLKNRSGMYKARKDRELMEVQDSHENKLLLMLTAPLRIGDCAGGHRLENRGKNRDVMVVPPDHSRPYLQTLHGESKDYTYINAVEVDGFTRKSEFIVTEWPKVPTLDSFWTLIFDHNVHTVISLTNQPSDVKQFPQFVHNKGKRNYGPFTVEVVNYQQYPGLQSHMVKISKRPMEEVIERRKWLWSRRKRGDRASVDGASGSQSTGGGLHRRVRRRPTLSNFLAECERYRRRHSSLATATGGFGGASGSGTGASAGPPISDISFRLQQRYWGKIHRRTPTPKTSSASSSSVSSSSSGSLSCSGSGRSASSSRSCCSTPRDGMRSRSHSVSSSSACSSCTRVSSRRHRRRRRHGPSLKLLVPTEEEAPDATADRLITAAGRLGQQQSQIRTKTDQQELLVVDEEENELLGVRRKTSRPLPAIRPLSTSALPDPPRTPLTPNAPGSPSATTLSGRKNPGDDGQAAGGVQMLLRGGSDLRTKRDARGRRLGGEWDKRLERRGDAVVALFGDRGGNTAAAGGGSGRRARLPGDDDDAATMARAETGTTTTGYTSTTKRRSNVTTSARRRMSRRRKRREQRRAERAFSQPNLGTLERFEKTFMISEIMASGASQQQLEAEVRLCCIIQVKMWPIENKVPLSTTALIEVLKMTRSWRKRAPDRPEQRPTIVMSHNGVSRCGIFIAANVCIDQMEMDHEVDVFHAVKLIRLNRPQLIDMKDEYKYLYDLMLHWYMTSPELRQFEPLEMSNSEPDDDDRSEDGASLGAATARGTRSRSGSAARRRRGSSRHDGHSLARSKSTRASSRHANATGANSAIQRVPTGGGRDNANSLAVSGGAQMLARNASSMSAGTAAGGGSRKRETIYLN
ncbi:hypothetical protein niasHS_011306 [Heterodera schachtii]|uniref:Uncharacterized protein n=1 Tax=Heterodera schachtii TaxID=97005 RepID=A0ABD2IU39_HETSC